MSINLNDAHVMTIRVALETMIAELNSNDAYGDKLRNAYLKRIEEIRKMLMESGV